MPALGNHDQTGAARYPRPSAGPGPVSLHTLAGTMNGHDGRLEPAAELLSLMVLPTRGEAAPTTASKNVWCGPYRDSSHMLALRLGDAPHIFWRSTIQVRFTHEGQQVIAVQDPPPVRGAMTSSLTLDLHEEYARDVLGRPLPPRPGHPGVRPD